MPVAMPQNDKKIPALSVIVPAFNEAEQITSTLRGLTDYLQPQYPQGGVEILIVDDGSGDETGELVRPWADEYDWIRCLSYQPNRGKGYAVRTGMLAARGQRRLFCDADLSIPIEELQQLEAALDAGADIAIGSKSLPGSVALRPRPLYRRAMGRVFNRVVRSVGLSEFRDTQCGFKLVTAAAAMDLFQRASVDGFAFDVELLLLARQRFTVREVAVRWTHRRASRVSMGLDSARMFVEIMRLRHRLGSSPGAAARGQQGT